MAIRTNARRTARAMRLSFCLYLGSIALNAASGFAAELKEGQFRRLLKELEPSKSALWRRVPWKTDLLAAQREAAKDAKPIFIWAMDGHPLGCT